MGQRYFIGVDVSKGKLDLAIILSDYTLVKEKVIKSSDKSISSFLLAFMKKTKAPSSTLFICCETSGIYCEPLKRVCVELGIDLWVEHALKIKRASTDFRGKSDRKDAMKIAEYAVRYYDRRILYVETPQAIQEINTLNKGRETLLGQKVALENQINEAKSHDPKLYQQLKAMYKSTLSAIEKSLKKIDDEIEKGLENNPEMKNNVELIQSVPGIGKRTAIQFVISTNNFENFVSAKHLACYAGVVPFANESGTIVKRQRISKMANLKLKTLLHLAAMAATRAKGDLKGYFIRKVQEGKNKMSVINAIRNKLVHRIWAVIERQTPYEII